MTREELLAKIKQHEEQCSQNRHAAFSVVEAIELADGVIAVRDDGDEFTVYFDKTKCAFEPTSPFEDVGLYILRFPENTGFITDVSAKSWLHITNTAKMSLTTLAGNQLHWRTDILYLDY